MSIYVLLVVAMESAFEPPPKRSADDS